MATVKLVIGKKMKQKPSKPHGFTLIEILIVLFIISIVSSVALLSIGRSNNRQIETFAKQLSQSIVLAEEQALLQPVVLGLSINQKAYRFMMYNPDVDAKNAWQPLQDNVLRKQKVSDNVAVEVKVNSRRASPQIVISTNGDLTPFTIYIGKVGQKPKYMIQGDADGTVTNKLLS